jgi:cytochrome d ubiquinol oxidase subunit II
MLMLSFYILLDGYDFGAGIIHLFFAKKEKDKELITKSIGPFWDANEVWLIAAGGILFFAFPSLYASAFSGFYLPLIMILWLLIFRAIGLELRAQINNKMWHSFWDKAFGISSLLLALFFGLALGNIIRGVNLGEVIDGTSHFEKLYFFLPLWNSGLDPLVETLGIIDVFTLLFGLIAVVSLTIHGANWIVFKTNSDLNPRLKSFVFKANIVLVLLLLVSLFVWLNKYPERFSNYTENPIIWIFPFITVVGLIGLFNVKKFRKDGTGLLFSSLFLFGGFMSSIMGIYPAMLPSSNEVNPSLTIWNTANSEYALSTGLYWFPIGAILIVVYFIIQHRVFKGKMDDVEYGEH